MSSLSPLPSIGHDLGLRRMADRDNLVKMPQLSHWRLGLGRRAAGGRSHTSPQIWRAAVPVAASGSSDRALRAPSGIALHSSCRRNAAATLEAALRPVPAAILAEAHAPLPPGCCRLPPPATPGWPPAHLAASVLQKGAHSVRKSFPSPLLLRGMLRFPNAMFSLQFHRAFQAEYEGSIPFTRSSRQLIDLSARSLASISDRFIRRRTGNLTVQEGGLGRARRWGAPSPACRPRSGKRGYGGTATDCSDARVGVTAFHLRPDTPKAPRVSPGRLIEDRA